MRGNHHERLGQRVGLPIDGDLGVAHRLQQCALRAGRGAVDLVGQHDVGEHRPVAIGKLARLGVKDVAADDVAGQEVGRELDAAEPPVHTARQGLGDECFAYARHILQQHVLAGQEGHDAQPQHVALAEHHTGKIGFEVANPIVDLTWHRRLRSRGGAKARRARN